MKLSKFNQTIDSPRTYAHLRGSLVGSNHPDLCHALVTPGCERISEFADYDAAITFDGDFGPSSSHAAAISKSLRWISSRTKMRQFRGWASRPTFLRQLQKVAPTIHSPRA